MTINTPVPNGYTSNGIATALEKFLDARSGARRFHAESIGKDVDANFCFSDFLVCLKSNNKARLETVYKAAMSTTAGGTGGYLVPQGFNDQLMADLAEESIFRKWGATVLPMASHTLLCPQPNYGVDVSSGQSTFFGGTRMYWTTEAVTETESDPSFRQLELNANELTAYVVASNSMLLDAAAGIEAWLRRLFSRSAAWYQDYAFFQGTGVGMPLGILKSAATISVTRAGANTIAVADVANIIGRILPASYNRAIWAVSLNQLSGVSALSKVVQIANFIPNGFLALYGLPMLPTEKLPALGSAGDIVMFDPSLYVIGDRMQTEISVSEHINFLNNQSVWRMVSRVDGQPWTAKPVELADGSSTASPYIMLAA